MNDGRVPLSAVQGVFAYPCCLHCGLFDASLSAANIETISLPTSRLSAGYLVGHERTLLSNHTTPNMGAAI